MNKEQYTKLKAETKYFTKIIRESKIDRKGKQRDFSAIDWEFNDPKRFKMTSTEVEFKRPEWRSKWKLQDDAREKIDELKKDFRWRHILLSLARGKKLNQIEGKTCSSEDDYWKAYQTYLTYKKVKESSKKYEIEDFDSLFDVAREGMNRDL